VQYLIVCVIVFASGYIGIQLANKYSHRVECYEILVHFCEYLSLNIYHLSDDVETIINKFTADISHKYIKDFQELIIKIKSSNLEILDLNNIDLLTNLSMFEKNEVCTFLTKLGKSDKGSQCQIIDGYKKIFEQKLELVREEKKQKGAIAFRLSVSIGVILCILII